MRSFARWRPASRGSSGIPRPMSLRTTACAAHAFIVFPTASITRSVRTSSTSWPCTTAVVALDVSILSRCAPAPPSFLIQAVCAMPLEAPERVVAVPLWGAHSRPSTTPADCARQQPDLQERFHSPAIQLFNNVPDHLELRGPPRSAATWSCRRRWGPPNRPDHCGGWSARRRETVFCHRSYGRCLPVEAEYRDTRFRRGSV